MLVTSWRNTANMGERRSGLAPWISTLFWALQRRHRYTRWRTGLPSMILNTALKFHAPPFGQKTSTLSLVAGTLLDQTFISGSCTKFSTRGYTVLCSSVGDVRPSAPPKRRGGSLKLTLDGASSSKVCCDGVSLIQASFCIGSKTEEWTADCHL